MLTLMLLIMSFFYTSFISLIYFRQKHIETIELKIFSKLLCANVIGLVIEMMAKISSLVLSTENLMTLILCRAYLIYLVWFSLFIAEYVYSVSVNTKNSEDLRNKYVVAFGYVVGLVSTLVVIILPVHFASLYSDYCTGPATSYLYFYSLVITLFCIYQMLKNLNNVVVKKYFPLLIYIVGLGVSVILQKLNPQITITTVGESFVLLVMYFTIENPDVKMLDEMELAKEAAEKANRAKTDFLSSMSHEIRTPLNAIVGFSDCIMDAESLGEAKENAKDIVNASQTLLEIVNGILDISKIEAGKVEIINSQYNAPETFDELAKLITPKMNEKGLDFTYNIAPDLPNTLFGDHANLKKIVTNLLSNACKYTDKGYVHYEVNCINTKDVCKLIISVEDSGRGIKKDNIDKMFTKFQRLDEDRNTTIEGTGLGLAITKQLIELMGGKIIVHTVYGEGSKFTVVINQRIEVEELGQKKKYKTTLDLTNVRILIVDDTALNLKVQCKLLEKFGANTLVTCDSGFECIERIKRGEIYDLILLDDMMPKMSGVETLKKLKEIDGFNIPTIALTANAITGMREKYLADGFDDYLAKPIEKEQLIQVVNQILGRSITEEVPRERIQRAINGPVSPSIRNDEIPNVDDYDKAEEERRNAIIPVEDDIESILGEKLDNNYMEEKFQTSESILVDHINENDSTEIKPIETIPVVDINVPIESSPNVDKDYMINNGVDMDHALELLGDMDMYNMTISDFMNEVEDKWNNIIEYKNTNNMPEYAILVHSLKSDCKYLGFMTLADIAYQHELKSKDNDSNYVNEHFTELEEEYKKVLEIAKKYVENNPVE